MEDRSKKELKSIGNVARGQREGRSHLSIRNCGLQRTLIIVFQGSLKAIKGLNKDNLKAISKVSEFLLFFYLNTIL